MLVTIWTMKPFKALFAPGGAFYSLVINFQSLICIDKSESGTRRPTNANGCGV
ncbi:hypothetical protein ACNKHT_19395 [Shigella flexneri]